LTGVRFLAQRLEHDLQMWKPLLRQDHAQVIDLARVLLDQVMPPGRSARGEGRQLEQEARMRLQLKPDGRQSETALMIQRGVARLMRASGFAVLPEFTLASGRRADIIGIGAAGEIWIIEIKSSPGDFRADVKWPEYRDYCDRLFFAIPASMDTAMMPPDTGLIVADSWGADILRMTEAAILHAARRKALTLAFARAAALRLHGLHDPPADGF